MTRPVDDGAGDPLPLRESPPDDITCDGFLDGRLMLAQFRRGHHRGGTDGVLAAMLAAPLCAAMDARLGRPVKALDMGAGSGLIGLALATTTPDVEIILAERDPDLLTLCRDNIQNNALGDRVATLAVDLLGKAADVTTAGLAPESQDIVITNPPWFDPGSVRASPGAGRRAAHVFAAIDPLAQAAASPEEPLQTWLRCACRLLRPGGMLLAIHRASALPDLLQGVSRRCGDIRAAPVQARANEPAIRVVLVATRGRRGPFTLDPPLVLHDPAGGFTRIAAAFHAGQPLPWGDWAGTG